VAGRCVWPQQAAARIQPPPCCGRAFFVHVFERLDSALVAEAAHARLPYLRVQKSEAAGRGCLRSTRLKWHAQSGSLQALQQRAEQQVRHPRAAGTLHRRCSETSGAQRSRRHPRAAGSASSSEGGRVHGAGHEAGLLQGRHADSRRRADGAHTRLECAGGLTAATLYRIPYRCKRSAPYLQRLYCAVLRGRERSTPEPVLQSA